jgi:hypothetical protein
LILIYPEWRRGEIRDSVTDIPEVDQT